MAQQSKAAAPSSAARNFRLSAFLDYFIPGELQVQPDAHRRVRMFMISHAFGPLLGNVIPLYLHFALNIARDYRFWTLLVSILAFWVYPFALRMTRRYQTVAFLSVQNLIFCMMWACYSYGGIFSPFLSWALVIPMASFFYLPAAGLIRNILVAEIIGSLAIFSALPAGGFDFPHAELRQFDLIGIISNFSLTVYVSMMALYFAKVVREQASFERELTALVTTADQLTNVTQAARQATAAKANFVVSMSGELRTPLNAVIGYSQNLLKDADAEGNLEFGADVRRVNEAGAHLLRLVNDILDFSKIEAGKMVCCPSIGSVRDWVAAVSSEARERLAGGPHTLQCEIENGCDVPLNLDWQSLKKSAQHLIYGIASESAGGPITMQIDKPGHGLLAIRVTDPEVHDKIVASESLFDVFSDDSDSWAAKYGGFDIALALSLKFVQLIGGKIGVDADSNGRRVFTMTIPADGAADALAA